MIGAWTLLLQTTGRRRLIVAPSNDGKDQAPGWFHNLCANPNVEVQTGRKHFPATASVISPSDPDYPRLWELMNKTNSRRYDAHQSKTSRPIPLVTIVPKPDR